MQTPRIFVSMGWPYTDDYEKFREELVTLLRDRCHTDPRIIGKNEYPSGNPLQKIAEVIKSCDGVMIVAYERKLVLDGVEKPGGKDERKFSQARYTTPWNHVESAIAYSQGLPIYIVVQRGLTQECLIESKVDWYVQELDFAVDDLRRPEVIESISTWIQERVVPHARKRPSALEGFSRLKPSEFTVEDWISLSIVLGAAFGAGAAIDHWFSLLLRP